MQLVKKLSDDTNVRYRATDADSGRTFSVGLISWTVGQVDKLSVTVTEIGIICALCMPFSFGQ